MNFCSNAFIKPSAALKALVAASTLMASSLPLTTGATEPTQKIFSPQKLQPEAMVMLAMSRDQQLFFKAYSDYDDIFSSRPGPEITYTDSMAADEEYIGYFDPNRCYKYNATNDYFEVERAVITGTHKCNTSGDGSEVKTWSGNFLNWATMTRADIMRHVLYGGYRRTDTATETILERAYLPNDAHSFAKFYGAADLTDYAAVSTADAVDGITICNTSLSPSVGTASHNLTDDKPMMRVAKGNYGLWAASERLQCLKDSNSNRGAQPEIERNDIGTGQYDYKYSYPYGQAGFSDVSNSVWNSSWFGTDSNGSNDWEFYNTNPSFYKKIEAEDWSAATNTHRSSDPLNTQPTSDNGGGLNVAWIRGNDTLSYTNYPIQISTTGSYTFNFRVASGDSPGGIQIYDSSTGSDVALGGEINVDNTGGWQAWVNKSVTRTLNAGTTYTFKLKATGGGNFNVNYFEIYAGTYSDKASWVTTEVEGINNGKIEGRYFRRAPTSLLFDYVVRVKACSQTVNGVYEANCQAYTGVYKPVGVLHSYADGTKAKFGLVTGSYTNKTTGGVLRKHIEAFSNEVNATNGTFITPSGVTGEGGTIVKTLDALRIAGWYKKKTDVGAQGQYLDDCPMDAGAKLLDDASLSNKCKSWGNPFAEIMATGYRYFAGANGNDTSFEGDDSGEFGAGTLGKTALTPRSWTANPYISYSGSGENKLQCAPMNLLALNASVISFDGDDLNQKVSNAVTNTVINTSTNEIGDSTGENIQGSMYPVVNTDGNFTNKSCSLQTISTLANVNGTCPEGPELKGTFKSAGLAYYARTHDINTNTGFSGNQYVRTFGVSLRPPQPIINVPGTKIEIVPACHVNASSDSNRRACSLVDFKVISQVGTGNGATGKYLVVWEDHRQGYDFDQDLVGTIEYTVSASTVAVKTNILLSSAYDGKLYFGYVILGVSDNDPATPSIPGPGLTSDANSSFTDQNNECADIVDCRKTVTYNWSNSVTVPKLQDPLFYAAKWGAFEYVSTSEGTVTKPAKLKPDVSTADTDNPESAANSRYFGIKSPSKLKRAIEDVIGNITAAPGITGGGIGVNPSAQGVGLSPQAAYRMKFTPYANTSEAIGALVREIKNVGDLNGLWSDAFGNSYEDTHKDAEFIPATASNSTEDQAITFGTSQGVTSLAMHYLSNTKTGALTQMVGAAASKNLKDLTPIWSARDELADMTNAGARCQRIYTDINTSCGTDIGKRHILTGSTLRGLKNTDGSAMPGHLMVGTIDFSASSFGDTTNYARGLNLASPVAGDAAKLVNYVRGDDSLAKLNGGTFRDRTIKFDNAAGTLAKTWRLGDIVNSAPLTINTAANRYDVIYQDDTYEIFRKHVANRRHVVYVGANDGLLHAFNAGFYSKNPSKYTTGSSVYPTYKQYPLGAELWAYAPTNLLPHLKWLKEPTYDHVFYVDGSPQQMDAKIFPPDADHPGGWGTLLVAKMRLGGQKQPVDHDGIIMTPALELNSAIMVFDVTNPEVAPKLLGEITHSQLGFTTSNVEIIRSGTEGANWHLVFGSGPTNSLFDSIQNARIFKLSLNLDATGFIRDNALSVYDSGVANSYVVGVTPEDWNRDKIHDAVYFTTTTHVDANGNVKSGEGAGGTFQRFKLSDNSFSLVVADTSKPYMARPYTVLTDKFIPWVYVGTGRYLTDKDRTENAMQVNTFYGVREEINLAAVTRTNDNLINVTNSSISGEAVTVAGSTYASRALYKQHLASNNYKGWRLNLNANERILHQPLLTYSQNFFIVSYKPDSTASYCSDAAVGQSYVREVGMVLGVQPKGAITPAIQNSVVGVPSAPVLPGPTSSVKVRNDKLVTSDHQATEPFFNPGRKAWHEILNP